MDRKQLRYELVKECGRFPNMTQIANFFGKSREYVRTMMKDCDYHFDGKSRQYAVNDVIDRWLERVRA
jgi:hypothetical protein